MYPEKAFTAMIEKIKVNNLDKILLRVFTDKDYQHAEYNLFDSMEELELYCHVRGLLV